jgi:hypothetical protein
MSKRSSKKSKRHSKAASNALSTAQSEPIVLGEEEISDISLATFHVYDKENGGFSALAQRLTLARSTVCVYCTGGCVGGCGGCAGCHIGAAARAAGARAASPAASKQSARATEAVRNG